MLEKIKEYAHLNNVPIIQDEGLNFLLQNIDKYNVKSILEVGSAIGYSAIMMAKANKDLNILTIEIDPKRYEMAKQNIEGFQLNDQISIINLDANNYKSDTKYDLIFLDGAKSQYDNMLNNLYDNLSDSGIIIVDNLGFHGLVYVKDLKIKRRTRQLVEKIKLFRKHIVEDDRFEVILFDDIGDGMGLLINKKGCQDGKHK